MKQANKQTVKCTSGYQQGGRGGGGGGGGGRGAACRHNECENERRLAWSQTASFRKHSAVRFFFFVVFLCRKKENFRSWKITALLSFSSSRLGAFPRITFGCLVCIRLTYRTVFVFLFDGQNKRTRKEKRKTEGRNLYPYTGSARDFLRFLLNPEHLHTFILALFLVFIEQELAGATGD